MNRHLMRQAKELEARLAKVQQELAETKLEVSSGGGAVKIVITGDQKVEAVKISPEAVDPNDLGLLEDLLVAAINEALSQSQNLAQQKLSSLTGGLKIPGLF